MQHQSITRPHPPGFLAAAVLRRFFTSPVALVLIFSLAVLALNPVGYKGGGADDWQYLQAARCAAEQLFCLPADHWWRRFAVVVPAGLAMRYGGEDQIALAIAPAIYSFGAIGLFVWIVQRQFGRREALIAGIVFAATPVVGERLIEINIDMAELFFAMASLACLQCAHRSGKSWFFPAAGALLALAILARPTQLALLPIFLAGFWLVPGWGRRVLPFLGGLLVPILAEASLYAFWAGDPLLPWKLSAAHTRIPSTELARSVDLSQSPLFNVAFIDGWKPAAGLPLHWTVKGLVNLLVHPGIGHTLLAALMLLGLDARSLRPAEPRTRVLLFLILGAMAFFGALVFAFAIDPKPRMFLPVLAVAATLFGVLAAERLRTGRSMLVWACLCLLLLKGVFSTLDQMRIGPAGATAAEWVRADPDNIAVTPLTSSLLAMTPEVSRLTTDEHRRSKLLVVRLTDCREVAGSRRGWKLVRAQLHDHEPALLRKLRDAGILNEEPPVALCLLQKVPAAPDRLSADPAPAPLR